MSAEQVHTVAPEEGEGSVPSYTVDELAAATGLTVRNTRYYASLGLLPPPERRGRVAFYGPQHKARLELVQALQAHGFTLAAVEKYLARLPADASPEDLTVQRVMLTSWRPAQTEVLTRAQVEARAGRPLEGETRDRLERMDALRPVSAADADQERFEVTHFFPAAVRLLDLDLPTEGLEEADQAISRHMTALADELTDVLRHRVVAPFKATRHSDAETEAFEQFMTELRELTAQAVMLGYQRAADEVVRRSLLRD